MKLTEVIRKVAPAVVAFGSRIAESQDPTVPGFPPLIGTGFFIDSRGLVVTNQHVVDALQEIPAKARFVMLFPEPISEGGQTQFGVVLRSILKTSSISSFEAGGPFFGEAKPDFAFVQIDVKDVPFLEVCGDSNTLEAGLEVATVGFPMGEVPLMPYDQAKASQMSTFARKGIISSVLPCPCADPHGFSIDIMSEGGASGSPIFRTDDPRAIGILHGGFPGAPITYGVPGHLLQSGLEVATKDWNPDLSNIPTLREVILSQRPKGTKEFTWSSKVILKKQS
jgi:Trypsin-like peptidase domain